MANGRPPGRCAPCCSALTNCRIRGRADFGQLQPAGGRANYAVADIPAVRRPRAVRVTEAWNASAAEGEHRVVDQLSR